MSEIIDPSAIEKKGRRWLIWSFILCPCHLPWTLGVLALLGGGVGGVVTANRLTIGLILSAVYFVLIGIGFFYIRKADVCKSGSCSM